MAGTHIFGNKRVVVDRGQVAACFLTGSMYTISTRQSPVSNVCLDSLEREEKSFRQTTSRVQLNLAFPVL